MLRIEKDSFPQEQAINALGHIGNPAAAPLVAAFAAHENTEVRFAVAVALGCFPNEPVSIDCLLVLMRDDDEDVREWATFGLGRQGDADSDDIRAALMVRLDDPFVNVRLEAIASLGKRRERRILSVLLTALEKPEIPMAIVEACWLMLGLENDREDWTAADYAKALRERWEPVLAPYGNGKCL
nr:HEAT repeat domain-containing protein [Rhodoblastus acidophilus]